MAEVRRDLCNPRLHDARTFALHVCRNVRAPRLLAALGILHAIASLLLHLDDSRASSGKDQVEHESACDAPIERPSLSHRSDRDFDPLIPEFGWLKITIIAL